MIRLGCGFDLAQGLGLGQDRLDGVEDPGQNLEDGLGGFEALRLCVVADVFVAVAQVGFDPEQGGEDGGDGLGDDLLVPVLTAGDVGAGASLGNVAEFVEPGFHVLGVEADSRAVDRGPTVALTVERAVGHVDAPGFRDLVQRREFVRRVADGLVGVAVALVLGEFIGLLDGENRERFEAAQEGAADLVAVFVFFGDAAQEGGQKVCGLRALANDAPDGEPLLERPGVGGVGEEVSEKLIAKGPLVDGAGAVAALASDDGPGDGGRDVARFELLYDLIDGGCCVALELKCHGDSPVVGCPGVQTGVLGYRFFRLRISSFTRSHSLLWCVYSANSFELLPARYALARRLSPMR